jgi:hypothetical protein
MMISEQTGTGPSTTRVDHQDFTIPDEYLGVSYCYGPDFMVRLIDGRTDGRTLMWKSRAKTTARIRPRTRQPPVGIGGQRLGPARVAGFSSSQGPEDVE